MVIQYASCYSMFKPSDVQRSEGVIGSVAWLVVYIFQIKLFRWTWNSLGRWGNTDSRPN
jgi:hypothetical protein